MQLLGAANEQWNYSLAIYAEGQVCWWQAEYAAAKQHFNQALQVAHQLGDKRGIAQNLEGLAAVATRNNSHCAPSIS